MLFFYPDYNAPLSFSHDARKSHEYVGANNVHTYSRDENTDGEPIGSETSTNDNSETASNKGVLSGERYNSLMIDPDGEVGDTQISVTREQRFGDFIMEKWRGVNRKNKVDTD